MTRRNTYYYYFRNTLPFLLIMAALGLAQVLPAQTTYIDSLKTELKKPALTDSGKISILEEIGYLLNHSTPEVSRTYFFEALTLLEKNHYDMERGVALAYIGMSYEQTDQLDSAALFIDKALAIMQRDTSIKSKANVGSLLNERGNIDKAMGAYNSAIDNYIRSNDITAQYETIEKWLNLAKTNFNIALVFQEMEQFDKAIDYDKKAQEAVRKGKQATTDPSYLNALEKTFVNVALHIIENRIALKEVQTISQQLDQQNQKLLKINDDDLYAYFHAIKGDYYKYSADWKAAEKEYLKSLNYAQNIGSRKFNALSELGNTAEQLKNYPESIRYYEAALALKPSRNKKKNEATILKTLAHVYALKGDYRQSSILFDQYVHLNDSLNVAGAKIRINEIENKYQAKQKQDSILVLQKNNQIQSLALHKKQNQNIFIFSGAVLVLLTGFFFYRNLRNKHRLLKQSEQMYQQQIIQLEKERKLVAVQSLMKGQEEERSRLAKDLHDGVGGLLSGVKLSLSNMKGNVFLTEENAEAVTKIIVQLDSSISELRRVSHNMMPEALIKYGLKEALENYCESIDRSGRLNVRLQIYNLDQRLEQDTEIILYRIVQELLNNAIKHAEAKEVLVQLIREKDRFTLTVEDDGKGFDPNDNAHRQGAGLQNVLARAGYLNGTVDVRSRPDEGTSVTIEGSTL